MIRIGVDTGGTFTDFVVWDGRQITVLKIISTPRNPAEAVLNGLARLADGTTVFEVVHGSTVATNALLERKGAKTALITTQGFEDVLEIGRQNRPELYNLIASRPDPLIPADRRFGVRERTLHTGEILQPINPHQVRALAKRLRGLKIESVAVCFLFSFVNPKNERAVDKLLKNSDFSVCLSHRILPEFREYERTSTTVVNAYLAPVMSSYLSQISKALKRRGALRIMQSNGGSVSAQTAINEPVRTILSGPAGGVVGARELARLAGYEKIISFDMGGTSTDVCLCDGQITTTTESIISNSPIGVPVIDVHTVGAGGGSIAKMDPGGALKVGPESAGSEPGPICYGRGGREITVTDANVLLGKIDKDHFLGGGMPLYDETLKSHFESFGRRLFPSRRVSSFALAAAQGVINVANANMEKAIRVISIERGHDPRDFTLVVFGGAGGLHACDLAQALSIPRILIPPNPGLLSALGVLLSDVVRDYSQTVMVQSEETSYERLLKIYESLQKKGDRDMRTERFKKQAISSERLLDVRYVGQAYELTIPFSRNYAGDFHAAHEKRYGYSDRARATEIVTVRVRFRGKTYKPALKPRPLSRDKNPTQALIKSKTVYFNGHPHETKLYSRDKLKPGHQIKGPAIIVEYSGTTAVPPNFVAKVDEWESLIIRTT